MSIGDAENGSELCQPKNNIKEDSCYRPFLHLVVRHEHT